VNLAFLEDGVDRNVLADDFPDLVKATILLTIHQHNDLSNLKTGFSAFHDCLDCGASAGDDIIDHGDGFTFPDVTLNQLFSAVDFGFLADCEPTNLPISAETRN